MATGSTLGKMRWTQYPLEISKKLPVLEAGPIYIDLETNGLDPFREEAKIHCIAISQDPDKVNWVRITDENKDAIRKILETHSVMNHRATFEGTWIRTHFGVLIKIYFDTKLGAFMIDENEETGLKHQAVMNLGCEPWGSEELDFEEVDDWDAMSIYNSKDSSHGLRLYRDIQLPHLRKHPKQAKLLKYILLPAQEVFIDVICKGFHINEPLAEERLAMCDEKLAEFNDKINEIAGREVNPGSPKQMVQLLYTDLGLRCPIKTKKNRPSTNEAALIRLASTKHPVIDPILEWRKWKKYKSTYLGPWLTRGPILHANYGFTNTDTGRLNSTMTKNKRKEKKGGATLHQCPRDPFIRNLIIPRGHSGVEQKLRDVRRRINKKIQKNLDEWNIVAADLSQIELRLVAHAANERTMIEIFQTGVDPEHILKYHTPRSFEYVGAPSCPDCDIHLGTASTLTRNEIDKETRKKAKAVNFGFVYGMWAKKFVAYAKEKFGLDLTKQEGERYREAFFNKYFDLERWYNRVESQVAQNGWIDSVFGRRRHLPGAMFGSDLPDWLRREAIRQGINSPIQSAGSDLNLFIAALIMSKSLKWGFKVDPDKAFMFGSAHDSQLFECRRDYIKELKEGIKYTLDNLPVDEFFGFEFKVPVLMDVTAYEDCWEGKILEL